MSAAQTFLAADRLYLRPLESEDADGPYPSWLNDQEICSGNSHHVLPYSRDAARDYIRSLVAHRDQLTLAIVLREGQQHVGNIALQKWDRLGRSAEFAILLGERSCWGTGIGFEAAKLVLTHGFTAMNLHRIHCGTFADNAGMIALAKKLGMSEEGRRREAVFKDGQFVDVVEFGLLKNEYKQ
ncbi:Protein N-acetyltransferase, RimJ/RimL family [Formivibrio citricus]|uniref:Protein N-acetyltransferase, RimJ/RimL family n=1 Tax=Formivibrio citricus TaxID=83765 RepID=A0A1I4VBD1_9NEIS|nr:GNAT family protein [Formivibrio citricus]SFM98493.1 Protein N-acetyltransferase, RimJ/RimL family [Formivibrio citricus]